MTAAGTGAVFFLGTRAHYQVLEQPNNCDVENGNASTETIYEYQNASVEELWPNKHADKLVVSDANCNKEGWRFSDHNDTVLFERTMPVGCVKRRGKRKSTEALLIDDVKPAMLNKLEDNTDQKEKSSRRVSVLSFLTSLARRKRRMESSQVHYLHHLNPVLTTCTYRESCRCLDCQGRYFECADESDDYSSDDDLMPCNLDIDSHALPQLDDDDDEVFINLVSDNDNTSTDLLLDATSLAEETAMSETMEDTETDKQLQMEVAASTSAMFNLLLYHPFSCSIQ